MTEASNPDTVNTRRGKAVEFPSCSYLYQPQRLHSLIFSTATNQNSVELHHCNLKIICHQINLLPHHSLTDCFPEVLEKCWRFMSLHACPQSNLPGAALNSKCFLWHSDFSFLLQLQLPCPIKPSFPSNTNNL